MLRIAYATSKPPKQSRIAEGIWLMLADGSHLDQISPDDGNGDIVGAC